MSESVRDGLIRALPYGRRYARALTGNQPEGDLLVAQSLRSMTSQPPTEGLTPLLQLYQAISRLYTVDEARRSTQGSGLSPSQRQLLLLTTLEEINVDIAARIIGLPHDVALQELESAQKQLHKGVQTSVLIIEDEPILALAIELLCIAFGRTGAGRSPPTPSGRQVPPAPASRYCGEARPPCTHVPPCPPCPSSPCSR